MLSAEGAWTGGRLVSAGDGPILVLLLCLEWCFCGGRWCLRWSSGADWGVLWWCSADAWGVLMGNLAWCEGPQYCAASGGRSL